MARTAELVRQVLLDLPLPKREGEKPAHDSLSAVAIRGETMWLANDEGRGLDRLIRSEDGSYGNHELFDLVELLDMPVKGEDAPELDIEGLDVDGDKLWLVGSHTWTRDNPKKAAQKGDDPRKALADVSPNPNRQVLACLPLTSCDGPDAVPRAGKSSRYPAADGLARLRIGKKRSALTKLLAKDELLGRFVDLPAKENGFDIEGLAVKGDRLFLGLRGPVLRGYAMVLELEVRADGKGELELRPPGNGEELCRKHVLHLGGNGIRDLHRHGDDLLILAGPTAAISGRCYVWRWRGAFAAKEAVFFPEVDAGQDGEAPLRRILELPTGDGGDHPEGMVLLPGGDTAMELLVVYDSPRDDRKVEGNGAVHADVFKLEG
jgi:Protein of unknown function (DUF3616)